MSMSSSIPKGFIARSLLIAGLLLISAFGALIYLRLPGTPTELEQAFASRNRQELADAALASRLSSINLVSASMPGTASQATHRLADISDPVILRLSLPFPEPDGKEFTALLNRNGKPVFTAIGARVFRNPMGAELRFLLPKSVLSPGRYQIVFADGHPEHESTSFQFTIE